MNREDQKVSVQIFNELYVIRGNGSEDHIRNLASDIDKRMRDVSLKFPRLAAHQVATLVALNLADEMAKLKEEHGTLMEMLGTSEEG